MTTGEYLLKWGDSLHDQANLDRKAKEKAARDKVLDDRYETDRKDELDWRSKAGQRALDQHKALLQQKKDIDPVYQEQLRKIEKAKEQENAEAAYYGMMANRDQYVSGGITDTFARSKKAQDAMESTEDIISKYNLLEKRLGGYGADAQDKLKREIGDEEYGKYKEALNEQERLSTGWVADDRFKEDTLGRMYKAREALLANGGQVTSKIRDEIIGAEATDTKLREEKKLQADKNVLVKNKEIEGIKEKLAKAKSKKTGSSTGGGSSESSLASLYKQVQTRTGNPNDLIKEIELATTPEEGKSYSAKQIKTALTKLGIDTSPSTLDITDWGNIDIDVDDLKEELSKVDPKGTKYKNKSSELVKYYEDRLSTLEKDVNKAGNRSVLSRKEARDIEMLDALESRLKPKVKTKVVEKPDEETEKENVVTDSTTTNKKLLENLKVGNSSSNPMGVGVEGQNNTPGTSNKDLDQMIRGTFGEAERKVTQGTEKSETSNIQKFLDRTALKTTTPLLNNPTNKNIVEKIKLMYGDGYKKAAKAKIRSGEVDPKLSEEHLVNMMIEAELYNLKGPIDPIRVVN